MTARKELVSVPPGELAIIRGERHSFVLLVVGRVSDRNILNVLVLSPLGTAFAPCDTWPGSFPAEVQDTGTAR